MVSIMEDNAYQKILESNNKGHMFSNIHLHNKNVAVDISKKSVLMENSVNKILDNIKYFTRSKSQLEKLLIEKQIPKSESKIITSKSKLKIFSALLEKGKQFMSSKTENDIIKDKKIKKANFGMGVEIKSPISTNVLKTAGSSREGFVSSLTVNTDIGHNRIFKYLGNNMYQILNKNDNQSNRTNNIQTERIKNQPKFFKFETNYKNNFSSRNINSPLLSNLNFNFYTQVKDNSFDMNSNKELYLLSTNQHNADNNGVMNRKEKIKLNNIDNYTKTSENFFITENKNYNSKIYPMSLTKSNSKVKSELKIERNMTNISAHNLKLGLINKNKFRSLSKIFQNNLFKSFNNVKGKVNQITNTLNKDVVTMNRALLNRDKNKLMNPEIEILGKFINTDENTPYQTNQVRSSQTKNLQGITNFIQKSEQIKSLSANTVIKFKKILLEEDLKLHNFATCENDQLRSILSMKANGKNLDTVIKNSFKMRKIMNLMCNKRRDAIQKINNYKKMN